MAVLRVDEFNSSKNKISYYIKELDSISTNIRRSIVKIDSCYNTDNKSNMEKMDELISNNLKKMEDNYKNYIFVMNKNSDSYKETELEVSESFEDIK